MEDVCVYDDNNKCIYNLSDTCQDKYLIDNIKKMIGNTRLQFLTCDNYILILLDKLGRGGYNEAYRTIESITGKEYVLRLTLEKKYDDYIGQIEKTGLYLQAYFSKTEKEGGLNCPYIAKVYSFGEYTKKDGNMLNYFMGGNKKGVYGILEYVKGGELFDRLEQKSKAQTKFKEEDISKLMFRLLTSLNCIHSKHFIHLDLKPQNILMVSNENDYDIKLIDFGLVRYIDNIKEGINPVSFGRSGTMGYKAPEVNFSKTCGTKADIWSVAIILINILLIRVFDFENVSKFPDTFYETLVPEYFFKLYLEELLQDYSLDCINFLTNILKIEPAERMSAEECLKHKWIKKYNKSFYITDKKPKIENKTKKNITKSDNKTKKNITEKGLKRMKKNELIKILEIQGKKTDGKKEILVNRILETKE